MNKNENQQTGKMDFLAEEIASHAVSTTEQFYNKMERLRDEAEKERTNIQGMSKRSLELDEFIARVNSVINALSPLYRRA